jgi:hypothetical protein
VIITIVNSAINVSRDFHDCVSDFGSGFSDNADSLAVRQWSTGANAYGSTNEEPTPALLIRDFTLQAV